MFNSIYAKLARKNMASNKVLFKPYIFMCSFIMFNINIIYKLYANSGKGNQQIFLSLTLYVLCLLSFMMLDWINKVCIKNRMKELGLLSVLGLKKSQIIRVLTIENIAVFLRSTIYGLIFANILSRLYIILYHNLLHMSKRINAYSKILDIDLHSDLKSILLFGGIFILAIAINTIRFSKLNPIEIVREQAKGEAPPKSSLLFSLVGFVLISAGYYIGIHFKDNAIDSIKYFFPAVFFVISGTYLIFSKLSINILKLIKSKKSYYYKPSHMISISTLMYRMKQSAISLASICILSTMVIITLASSVAIFLNIETQIQNFYKASVVVNSNTDFLLDIPSIKKQVNDIYKQHDIQAKDEYYFNYSNIMVKKNATNSFETVNGYNSEYYFISVYGLEDYNRTTNTNIELSNKEAFIISSSGQVPNDYITIRGNGEDLSYKLIEDKTDVENKLSNPYQIIGNSISIVVKDINDFDRFDSTKKHSNYIIDLNDENKEANYFAKLDVENAKINLRPKEKIEAYNIFGSITFVGIFLSIIFLISSFIIMYYKQLMEAYQDRKRYNGLNKIGIESKVVKSIIKTQVKNVFFLPLLLAFIHCCAAVPILSSLLKGLGVFDIKIVIVSMLVVYIIYCLYYYACYKLSTKIYYKTINKGLAL